MEVKNGNYCTSFRITLDSYRLCLGKLKTTSLNDLLLNAIGALILGIDAFIGKQWGFVLLEGVCSIVAIHGLYNYFNKKEVK